jgi:hypothetical protein
VFLAGHGKHFDEALPLQSDPVENRNAVIATNRLFTDTFLSLAK